MFKKGISFLLYSIVSYIEGLIEIKVSNNSSGVICSLLKTVNTHIHTHAHKKINVLQNSAQWN